MSRPMKNRERFFRLAGEGLQRYFDQCDRDYSGILHLMVGVKRGRVGGIIKSGDLFAYEEFAPREAAAASPEAAPKRRGRKPKTQVEPSNTDIDL